MNRFDKYYDIRLADKSEIPEVMRFIQENWSERHILARDRDFFEYEMVVEGQVNFLIAKRKDNNYIDGILGFLPCSKNHEKYDLWGVVWKTVDKAVPMLGIELKKRLMVLQNARTDLGVGANSGTSVPLLGRIMHYYTAKMEHYYCLSDRDDYKIAVINHAIKFLPIESSCDYKLLTTIEEFKEFFDFKCMEDQIPYKDSWYINRRYYMHPIYTYELWGISDYDNKGVVVIRIQECNGSSAARIVDFMGKQELFSKIGKLLNELLRTNEYVDFYFDGLDKRYVEMSGMTRLQENDTNIIPAHFYPYEQKNIDIWVDSSNRNDRCLFFLADGDQDRPS